MAKARLDGHDKRGRRGGVQIGLTRQREQTQIGSAVPGIV